MKGLEISVLKYSNVVASSPTFRVDSQFFRKEFLACDLGSSVTSVGDVCAVRSGTTPPDRDDNLRSGVILLKTDNIRNNVLPSSGAEDEFYYISANLSAEMEDTVLQPHDVLINIVGATTDVIGRVAYVPEGFPKANITQAMALMRVGDKRIHPAYLFSFLAGKYGQKQVRRIARPTGQYNMNLPEVRSLNVPILGRDVQSRTQALVTDAHKSVSFGRETTKGAEEMLLRALGLENWQPPEPLTYTRRASDVFAAGRFDAEMLQPRYDALRAKLEKVAGLRTIDDFAEVVRSDFVPTADRIYQYTEISDVNTGSGDVGWNPVASEELPANAKIRLSGGELLVSKVRPTRGAIGINYDTTLKDHVCSGAFLVLRVASPRREFLQVFLRSKAGKLLLEERCKGSSYPTLDEEDIRAVVAPEVDEKLMNAIKTAAENAHNARRRAHALLERAKKAVEVAIEESESAALKLLAEQLEV